jgi:hypothetical protein
MGNIFDDFRINSFCRLPESKFIFQLKTKTIIITNYHQIFIIRGFEIELRLFKEQNRHQNDHAIWQCLKKWPRAPLSIHI